MTFYRILQDYTSCWVLAWVLLGKHLNSWQEIQKLHSQEKVMEGTEFTINHVGKCSPVHHTEPMC